MMITAKLFTVAGMLMAAGAVVYACAQWWTRYCQSRAVLTSAFPDGSRLMDDRKVSIERAELWMRLAVSDLDALVRSETDYDQAMATWERLLGVERDMQKLLYLAVTKMDKLERPLRLRADRSA